jgi:predicted TIM-barrel fold metal-dependent hydrolase
LTFLVKDSRGCVNAAMLHGLAGPNEERAMATLSKSIDYRLFDADNHYYEPVDLFERYIEPRYVERTLHVEERDGETVVSFDGRPFGMVAGVGHSRRIRPGALRARLRGERPELAEDVDDSYVAEPDARIEMMDRQGIEATLMFPSTGVTIENATGDDIEFLLAHIRAFNRWLSESWTFNYKDRILSPALINLADADAAVAELEFVLDRGARAIQVMPGPAQWSTADRLGRSPADPVYDPFWARIDEAGTLVCFHSGNTGYMEHYSADWGENPDPDGMRSDRGGVGPSHPDWNPTGGRTAFQWTMLYRDRPIMDTLAILVYHNLFGRFPNVQVASVENGSIWVPYLLRAMDNMKGMARGGPWPNGYVEGRPSEIFKRHVYIAPWHYGEDVAGLVELLGAERVLFGSDFPHVEGMSDIGDYQEKAGEYAASLRQPDSETRSVMRDNGLHATRMV